MWPAIAVIVGLAATGCDPGVPQQSPGPDAVETFANAAAPLTIPTYDGSGQAVEPSVLHFADGWQGHPYWMAVSPYPFGHAALENPSILVSEDGLTWSVPEGLTNPLVLPTQGTLSDATLVHDDTSDQLWVYYNSDVRVAGIDVQSLDRLASSDGIHGRRPSASSTATIIRSSRPPSSRRGAPSRCGRSARGRGGATRRRCR